MRTGNIHVELFLAQVVSSNSLYLEICAKISSAKNYKSWYYGQTYIIFLSTKTAMIINFNYLHACQIDETFVICSSMRMKLPNFLHNMYEHGT